MNTKEAIEFCEIHRWKNPRSALILEGFKNVEILLQRGEKFEKMWGEFEVYIEGTSEALTNKMNKLWQKYILEKEDDNK